MSMEPGEAQPLGDGIQPMSYFETVLFSVVILCTLFM
jgi:hypothetical protein